MAETRRDILIYAQVGVAYTLGDFVSQVYQGRDAKTVDLARSARSGAAGFVGHGPLCHYWMVFMETYLDFDGRLVRDRGQGPRGPDGLEPVPERVLLVPDRHVRAAGPARGLEGRQGDVVAGAAEFVALLALVHCISFSHLVPLDLKLCGSTSWRSSGSRSCPRSSNDDKEARLAERGLEEDAEVLEVVEPFGVDPTLEIELTREFELDASLNADLENEDQFDENKLSFELPREALLASWPLLAMWPVIYGTFQLERMS